MQIEKLYIQAFGKIRDFTMTFSDGLNVIQQDNGFGKTTLANFVKAMLYGIDYTARGERRENDIVRFQPWDGTKTFGGYLLVKHQGQTYRVERFFCGTARNEKLSVTNNATGLALDLGNCKSVGEYFTGLTEDSYVRSAYYPQESVAMTSNQNFDAKLANLVENTDGTDKDVVELVNKYKKKFVADRGNGGEVDKLSQQLYTLRHDYNNVVSNAERADEIKNRLQQIEHERATLTENRSKLLSQTEQLQQQYAQAQPGEAQQQAQKQLADLQRSLAKYPPQFDEDKATCDNLAKQLDALPSVAPKAKINRTYVVLAILLVAVGVCLLAVGKIAIGVIIAVVGVGFGIFEVVFPKSDTADCDKRHALEQEYLSLASKYVNVGDGNLSQVKENLWKDYQQYKSDLRYAELLQANLRQNDNGKAEQIKEQIDNNAERIASTDNKLLALSQEQGSKATELQHLDVDIVAVADKVNQTEVLLDEAKYKYTVAEKTAELFIQAKNNLSSSYLPRLCQTATELLQYVTQSGLEVVADKNFAISLRIDGQTRRIDCFSRGIREITFLCFRIALSKLLYNGEVPFVIVDDAFVNYDESNFSNATKLLASIAQNGQVIYFTCHKRLASLQQK